MIPEKKIQRTLCFCAVGHGQRLTWAFSSSKITSQPIFKTGQGLEVPGLEVFWRQRRRKLFHVSSMLIFCVVTLEIRMSISARNVLRIPWICSICPLRCYVVSFVKFLVNNDHNGLIVCKEGLLSAPFKCIPDAAENYHRHQSIRMFSAFLFFVCKSVHKGRLL